MTPTVKTDQTPPHKTGSSDNVAWLTGHRQAITSERDGLRRAELAWSWARLLLFLAAIGVWYPLRLPTTVAMIGTVVFLLKFGACVRKHRRAERRRQLADDQLLLIEESLRRCEGGVTLIRSCARPSDPTDVESLLSLVIDDGPTAALTDQERDDLDLYFAPVGLFGLLNRTSTCIGARRLRDIIERPCLDRERIRTRRSAVRHLDERPADRFRIMAPLVCLRGSDAVLDRLVSVIAHCEALPASLHAKLFRVWGVMSGLFALWASVRLGLGHLGWIYPLVGLIIINALTCWRMRPMIRAVVEPWSITLLVARHYLAAAERAIDSLPAEDLLGVLRQRLCVVVDVLPALNARVAWTGSGGMLHALLNNIIFWDLHVADAVLSRAAPNRQALLDGLSALAELEMIASLACFAWEEPGACYAELVDRPEFVIEAGRHPLIAPDKVVPNDVSLTAETRMWIVTGSNMSGKSTMLRMIGTNALLAQIGTVSLAGRMTLQPVRLITDLRAADSLSDAESYFLAEVRHIRRMVLPPDDGVRCLGLIDEPFRGTNSQEQEAASLAVAEHLLASDNFFVIATHDQRLTELAERGEGLAVVNHHFREDLDGEGLTFDYRCRPGPAQTRNALRVLEREGYPEALVQRAYDWLRGSTEEANRHDKPASYPRP